mmetsp:Transcript_19402/g.35034  ORF Transcript_19402/g.35034 Transcript_19402/m.35034 type:complete len:184 (-) Transcript_19402:281-832(-)|eukprot:CAMPEP_0175051866 /NCGR_PEP_ID=MMETSP0052_2-20121109/8044_1 /TAXON_ID=51329 ORGANISM="Polytomella parva, Strain SAG 63-3" /NCGR_SAMPLE_ID=MMETSP0052_2 /ASSEMBLY_ACC=CAM_ASM_000194 /LENGTH=183 /DNA_ID=CAMNT_0016316211 /DNA_START=111 /DNA_END=662 /DNA_ORIENTATION=+
MSFVDPTCPVLKNVLLLDSEGKRIAVKYFSEEWSTVNSQANFERLLWSKTNQTNARGDAEITMFDNNIVVYKFTNDLFFYVTGSIDENEIILYSVLQAFNEAISILLRQQVEKKTVLENLDLVLLTIDEIVDGGLILETDPQTIASRVKMHGAEMETPVVDQVVTLSRAFATAREHLAKSLLR